MWEIKTSNANPKSLFIALKFYVTLYAFLSNLMDVLYMVI